MAYYKNYRKRSHYGTSGTYSPPKTYKNRKPTLEEFEIDNINIEEIETDRSKFKKKNDRGGIYLYLWFMFGIMVPILLMSLIGYDIDKESPIISTIICLGIYGLGFYIIDKLTIDKKYPKEELYNKIQNYKNACKEYEWWQKRKVKDFWTKLDGREFEKEIANIFRRIGYKATVCKQGGDEGIDIELEKNNEKEIVQCKAHKSKISPSVARDLCGTMINANVKHAYLVTLHGGTTGTIDFCRKNNITIWDVDDIIKYNKM